MTQSPVPDRERAATVEIREQHVWFGMAEGAGAACDKQCRDRDCARDRGMRVTQMTYRALVSHRGHL